MKFINWDGQVLNMYEHNMIMIYITVTAYSIWDNMYYIVLYSAFIAWFIEFVRILVMGTEISVGDCMHLSA